MTQSTINVPTPAVAARALPQDPAHDSLLRLAQVDIPEERRRLKAIAEPTTQQCMAELAGTSLDLVQEIAKNQVDLRDWVYDYLNNISEHMEALQERLETLENYGEGTNILPEDAEVLSKVIIGCRYLSAQLLQGPFPIHERDEEGKQKLAELIALSEQAEKIVADAVMPDVDDTDDDDDLPDTDDDSDDDVGPS